MRFQAYTFFASVENRKLATTHRSNSSHSIEKMKLFFYSIAFMVICCDVNAYLCRYYDEDTKSLEIYCGHREQKQQQKSPLENCPLQIPSLNTLGVKSVKVEGCYESDPDEIDIESTDFFDISYSGIRSVDWSIDASESIVDYDASFNELIEVPKAILRKYPKLETLKLAYNSLTRIYDGDFKFGQKLQGIDLSHNMLEFIEPNAFANLTELHFIDLKDNQFVSLPVLNDLYASTIDMEENARLSTFDCLSFSRPHKSSFFVRLSWEYIKSFSGDFNCHQRKFNVREIYQLQGVYTGPPQSEQIDLVCNNASFQNVQYFVAGHFHNVSEMLHLLGPSTWKIDLSGNYVGELDGFAFQRFRFLRELILSDTGLTHIDIGMLVNSKMLNRLDISENHLEVVENSILLQYFGHLIDFNVAKNQIESADEIIRYLPPSVQRLNLSGNNLTLTNAFYRFVRLNALKYLNLSDTNISALHANAFKSLGNLISLDLSHNHLNSVDFASILSTMNRLKEFRAASSQITNASAIIEHLRFSVLRLDLSGNNIGPSINASLFQILSKLRHLNLSGTHLQDFDLESLIPLRELRTLDISSNQLHSINLKPLANFTSLERLYLNENDLTKLDDFNWNASPNVSLAISRNNMACAYLRQLNYENSKMKIIGNQLDQKHGADCRASTQGISDFLGSVYDTVKFW